MIYKDQLLQRTMPYSLLERVQATIRIVTNLEKVIRLQHRDAGYQHDARAYSQELDNILQKCDLDTVKAGLLAYERKIKAGDSNPFLPMDEKEKLEIESKIQALLDPVKRVLEFQVAQLKKLKIAPGCTEGREQLLSVINVFQYNTGEFFKPQATTSVKPDAVSLLKAKTESVPLGSHRESFYSRVFAPPQQSKQLGDLIRSIESLEGNIVDYTRKYAASGLGRVIRKHPINLTDIKQDCIRLSHSDYDESESLETLKEHLTEILTPLEESLNVYTVGELGIAPGYATEALKLVKDITYTLKVAEAIIPADPNSSLGPT